MKMLIATFLAASAALAAAPALAQSSGSTPTSTTKFLPVYGKGNFSAGGYGTTTVTGGYISGGQGQPIPNGSRGSMESSSAGAALRWTFK